MTKWLLGKIRYMFWSTIISGAIMIATVFSPKSQEKLKELLLILKSHSQPPQVVVTQPERSLQDLQAEPAANVELPPLPFVSEIEDHEQVSASSSEYVAEEENYVLIEGKYYKAREDNKYEVNGRTVFYINNRKVATAKKEEVPEIQKEGEQAELNLSPQDMMKALKQYQKSTEERNQILKDYE